MSFCTVQVFQVLHNMPGTLIESKQIRTTIQVMGFFFRKQHRAKVRPKQLVVHFCRNIQTVLPVYLCWHFKCYIAASCTMTNLQYKPQSLEMTRSTRHTKVCPSLRNCVCNVITPLWCQMKCQNLKYIIVALFIA